MNIEELISEVDILFSYGCDKKCSECNGCPIKDAFLEIKNVLSKEIPMKPQEINEERIRLDGIWDWSCGNCGRFHRNDYPLNYCNECGQMVDWSDWT